MAYFLAISHKYEPKAVFLLTGLAQQYSQNLCTVSSDQPQNMPVPIEGGCSDLFIRPRHFYPDIRCLSTGPDTFAQP